MRRHCPICGATFLRFKRSRPGSRDRGACPRCDSRQRHRHLWVFLQRHTDLFEARPRTLHFAPEKGIERALRERLGERYVTADLEPGRGDLTADITALDLPDAAFDAVLCVHVLEHVPDDAAAMRELHRVLAPGGWGVFQVPIQGETTREDPSVIDPAERLARYGQEDHVRMYGRDFGDRLAAAGFEVDVRLFRDEIPEAERRRLGLTYDLEREFGVDFNAIPEPWEVWLVRKVAPRRGPD
jgi:SAM-dependent methyltransferase